MESTATSPAVEDKESQPGGCQILCKKQARECHTSETVIKVCTSKKVREPSEVCVITFKSWSYTNPRAAQTQSEMAHSDIQFQDAT